MQQHEEDIKRNLWPSELRTCTCARVFGGEATFTNTEQSLSLPVIFKWQEYNQIMMLHFSTLVLRQAEAVKQKHF